MWRNTPFGLHVPPSHFYQHFSLIFFAQSSNNFVYFWGCFWFSILLLQEMKLVMMKLVQNILFMLFVKRYILPKWIMHYLFCLISQGILWIQVWPASGGSESRGSNERLPFPCTKTQLEVAFHSYPPTTWIHYESIPM